ncbi:hypothetical protein ZWY2020_015696 [Hordeum vulgare]|nr:hypothetical protein ZWY2020_015696 [Hordeum vulgare]
MELPLPCPQLPPSLAYANTSTVTPFPFLFLLVLLTASPLVSITATFDCIDGVYKDNITYQANLCRLVAVLSSETADIA